MLMLFGVMASFICYARTHFFTFFLGDDVVRYFDTDDYMTIVWVRDFFHHWDLSNHIIMRANVPFGGDMHWTRIYDFFLIIPSYILNLFIGNINKSTEYVGLLISPVIKCVTIVVLFDFFKKTMTSRTAAFLAALIFAIHPAINYINMFARPDHHAFIMMMMVVYIHYLAEICRSDFKDKIASIKAGITVALCVWTSPETLIFLLISETVLFLCVHNDVQKLQALYQKNVVTTCAIGVIVLLFCKFDIIDIVCFTALSAVSYFTLKKFHLWHLFVFIFLGVVIATFPQVEYDKISVVHLVLYICSTIFFGIAKLSDAFWKKCSFGCTIGVAFILFFPKFFYGMEGGMSEALKTVWLAEKVDEMKSPFHFGLIPSAFFAMYMAIASVAIYNKIYDLTTKKREQVDIVWWILITSCLCYQICAAMADRMRPTFAFFSIPLIVELGMSGSPLKMFPKSWRIALTCVLALSVDITQKYYFIIKSYMSDSSGIKEFCKSKKQAYEQEDRFFRFLNGISEKPATILTYLGKSSMALYYTKHNVVAVPYHRQEHGILAFYDIMENNYDEQKIKNLLKKTKTDYIFISKSMTFATLEAKNSFVGMIVQGILPEWITIIDIPHEFEDVILAKVDRK